VAISAKDRSFAYRVRVALSDGGTVSSSRMRRFLRIQNAKAGQGPATGAERSKAYRTRAKERAGAASIEDSAWLARYETARSNASVLRERQSAKIPPKRLESAKAVAKRIVRSTRHWLEAVPIRGSEGAEWLNEKRGLNGSARAFEQYSTPDEVPPLINLVGGTRGLVLVPSDTTPTISPYPGRIANIRAEIAVYETADENAHEAFLRDIRWISLSAMTRSSRKLAGDTARRAQTIGQSEGDGTQTIKVVLQISSQVNPDKRRK